MCPEQAVAYVNAQTALLHLNIARMMAENQHRMVTTGGIAYGDMEFTAVQAQFEAVIGHTALMKLFNVESAT